MKRSEFKAMIREAVMECLPDIVEAITENITMNKPLVIENKTLPSITSKYKQASNHGYDDLPNNVQPSVVPRANRSEIQREQKKIVEMGGILEWVKNTTGGKIQPQSEFKHTDRDVDNFLKNRFGV